MAPAAARRRQRGRPLEAHGLGLGFAAGESGKAGDWGIWAFAGLSPTFAAVADQPVALPCASEFFFV